MKQAGQITQKLRSELPPLLQIAIWAAYSFAMTIAAHIDHTGGTIAWRESGAGRPVIFLHGLGGTRTSWGAQLGDLSDEFHCIAWDMPGYGDSEPLAPLTYASIADALAAFIDERELDKPDLVGLSFGGMHALHTAIRHPDKVGRLVLADSSPAFGMDGTTREEWTAARLAPLDRGETPADAAEHVVDMITAVRLTGQVRDETVGAFDEISPVGFRAAVECLPSNDVRSELADIEHETLVIVGELDEETPPSYAKVLSDGMPNAKLVVLDGVGHLSPAEDPVRFNDHVRRFLMTGQDRS